MYLCDNCGKEFTRESSLYRHIRESCRASENYQAKRPRIDEGPSTSTSSNETVLCNCCNKHIPVNARISHLRTLEHKNNACVDYIPNVQLIKSAFKLRIASYRVISDKRCSDYDEFFSSIKNTIIQLLEEVQREHNMVKVNMEVFARYILQTQERLDIKSFNTINKIIDGSTDINAAYDSFVDLMKLQTTEFQERDSGKICFNVMLAIFVFIHTFLI